MTEAIAILGAKGGSPKLGHLAIIDERPEAFRFGAAQGLSYPGKGTAHNKAVNAEPPKAARNSRQSRSFWLGASAGVTASWPVAPLLQR